MKLPLFFLLRLFVTACVLSGCASHEKPYNPDFTFKHTKAEKCDIYWLTLERLIRNKQVMCSELLSIDGFPYLRGTRELIEAGLSLNDKKSLARWMELMRTVDVQARYREIDALPDTGWGILCSNAMITNCETGRLRAYTARCSALLLGDERINSDYIKKLKESCASALERDYPEGMTCFKDRVTLDGTVPDNLSRALTDSGPAYRAGTSLERRINRIKSQSSGNRLSR